jgi:hypothetical protein
MKTYIIPIMMAAMVALLSACGNSAKDDNTGGTIITEKIEYPVFIKSPYPEENGDWWKENIETSKRTEFVEMLMDWAYSGKVGAYDFLTNEPLTVEQVKQIGNERDTIRVTKTYPPYDEMDTVIQQKLDLRLIHKIKFLEEWSYNLTDHSFSKKVLGIAPTLTMYDDSADLKGYRPLFWMYFDKDFIEKEITNKEKK